MKSLLFGPRRSAGAGSPSLGSVEAALAPAFADGRWLVPSRFNFTRDVVEALAQDRSRRALTYLGHDVVIEPRTFSQLALGAAHWATLLREAGVRPGDRVLVLVGATPEWVEIMLGAIKVGAVAVPSSERLTASALDIRLAASGAKVAVASRRATIELGSCSRSPTVIPVDTAAREAQRLPKEAPTHDTGARDPAFILSTTGRTNGPRGVLHTHASAFAARVQAEHWLDAGLGDVVWCTSPTDSPQALWGTLLGPWARGASVVLHDRVFDPAERLDLLGRLGVTVLCQTPAEYRALAETGRLARHRWARPRRLVSTGDELPDDLVQLFEDEWGLTIQDGYSQAEAGVVIGHRSEDVPRGSLGRPLPGYDVGVIDECGDEVPAGCEGALALRGSPPSLFAGYWNAPDATNAAYRGDWFVTGDAGVRDEDGFLWLTGRHEPSPRPVAAPVPEPALVEEPIVVASPPAPQVEPPAPAQPRRAEPAAAQPVPEPAPDPAVEAEPPGRRTSRIHRLTLTLWVLAAGVMIGGVAIPHAQDQPRVVPRSEDAPNAICLAPRP